MSYRRDPSIKGNFGMTLLHTGASASLGNLEVEQNLLDFGANINVQDNNGLTPLHLAVPRNNYKALQIFITRKDAVYKRENRGKTGLDLFTDGTSFRELQKEPEKQKKSLRLVKKLLQSGAYPNLPDIYGETPIMRAVRQNDFAIVKEMLMFGGNVQLRNVDSDTCLHLQSRFFGPNKDILVELVKHGACVNCFGSRGKSVMDFILQCYQAEELETVKLLLKTTTLVNWGNKICFELETNREFHCLEEFIDSCYTEVSRMKSCSYSDKSNLCHFALNGGNASQKDKSSGKSIFDEVLETLMKDNFPIYDYFIRAHFNRTFLFEKSLTMNVYARNKEENKAVHLNSYIMFEVAPYLSDKDLFNLVRAYSKLDVLRIKNNKINQFDN